MDFYLCWLALGQLAYTMLNCLFCYLRTVHCGIHDISMTERTSSPSIWRQGWMKGVCSLEGQIVGHSWPGTMWLKESGASQASLAPSCFPAFSLPVPMSPWVRALPSIQPLSPAEQVYSKTLETIWQREKEAIVCLLLESHNLFFLQHLYSHPHLLVATEN